jgi:hypothetical protein
MCTISPFAATSLIGLTTTIIWQGAIIGASVGGAIISLLLLFVVIYFKRRQRLRKQVLRTGISIDVDANATTPKAEARETPQTLAHGTLTPFTFPLALHSLSQLQTPLTKSPPTAFPPMQPRLGEQPSTDSDGREMLVEMMRNMHHIQERLLHLEGHLPGEGDRDPVVQRTSNQNTEDPFEIRSDGTLDAPPTYRE